MNATMSVDQYRKEVRDPALARELQTVDPRVKAIMEKHKEQVERLSGEAKKVLLTLPLKIMEQKASQSKPERKHEEDDITKQVTQYLELLMMQKKVLEFTHTANETYTSSIKQKARNTAMGVRSGIPDMIIITHGGVLFLELKREKGGVVSEAQKRWIALINQAGQQGGVHAEVAKGFLEARIIIDRFVRYTSGY